MNLIKLTKNQKKTLTKAVNYATNTIQKDGLLGIPLDSITVTVFKINLNGKDYEVRIEVTCEKGCE